MFCKNCGHEVNDSTRFCPHCGTEQQNGDAYFNKRNVSQDEGNLGFAVLSFFFPIVGLILFICWKNEKPKSAKQAGLAAIASVVVNVLMIAFFVCCIMVGLNAGA